LALDESTGINSVQGGLRRVLFVLSQGLGKPSILKVVVNCQHAAPPAVRATVLSPLP